MTAPPTPPPLVVAGDKLQKADDPIRLSPHRVPMPTLSVVIPLFNEEQNLPILIERVLAALAPHVAHFEIVCVDDGSRDRTAQVLAEIAQRDPRVKGVCFGRNHGQTAAMMAGFDHARGEIVVAMDGDLQNDPDDIVQLVKKLEEGYDLVSGWRKNRQDAPLRRNFLSRVANQIISRSTGIPLHDYGCSLKAYRRKFLEGVNLYGEMHRFIPVYVFWNGARIAEVPVRHHARQFGKSNYGMDRVVKVLLDLLVVLFLHRYAQKPIYVFGLCGIGSLAVGGLTAVAAILYKVFGDKSFIETPLPLISATTFFTGVLCFLIGLVAELSIRTYHESQGKPIYRVATRLNLEAPGRK